MQLGEWFEKLRENALAAAEAKGVNLITDNRLEGSWRIQPERLQRGIFNIVLNAVEYTPKGKTVYLEGKMTDNGWQVCVKDEGTGLMRRQCAMRLSGCGGRKVPQADGHHGLGLWSAAQAIRAHKGELVLGNWKKGEKFLCGFRGLMNQIPLSEGD